VELEMRDFENCVPIEMWSKACFPPIRETPYVLTLGPHNFLWFRIVSSEQAKEIQRQLP
jgi:maltose alpha-D-glucosyltransferase/alpha-amylase